MEQSYPFILTFMFCIRINNKWKFKTIHKIEFNAPSIDEAFKKADLMCKEFHKDTGTNMHHIVSELRTGILI